MKLDLRFDELFARPIDDVWRALTEPVTLASWLMENDFQARVGHRFTLRETPDADCQGVIECEVLELEPPHRMVWSWQDGPPGTTPTRVLFELRAETAGTRLTLRHLGEVTPAQGQLIDRGWTRKLAALRALDPGATARTTNS